MIDLEPLPFIKKYLECLQKSLKEENAKLSTIQFLWIGFCLMGILVTNSIAWAKFERASLGSYSKQALSKMFLHSRISWEKLLTCSLRMILQKYGLSKGVLIVDDKDHARSKNAKHLHSLHKIRDKKTNGYFLGQNIILLYLVTETFCIPISFSFYFPDPKWKEWKKNDDKLKKQGTQKKDRPRKPKRSEECPKKIEIALCLLSDFSVNFPELKVTCVLADALYGTGEFLRRIEKIWPNAQVISQLRTNQNINFYNKKLSCKKHFKSYKGWMQKVIIRGSKEIEVEAGGARVQVCSHGEKRFVIAVKYKGESEYRYLVGSKLSWNIKEIIQIYSLRWFVEVFFEDWSAYCGFCSMAKQCGVKGSERPLILSLLFDHCFLLNNRQQLFIKDKLPLATLGSLTEKSRFDVLCNFLKKAIESEEPKESLDSLRELSESVFSLRRSRKHLSGLNVDLDPELKRAA